MNGSINSPTPSTPSGPAPAGFHAASCAVWLAGALPLSLAAAWLAVLIEPNFAPLVVFPVLVGLCLGAVLAGWMRLCRMAHRKTALLGVLAAVAMLVWGQHYLAYRHAQSQIDERFAFLQRAQLEMGEVAIAGLPAPPESLVGFLRQTAEQGRPLAGHVVRGAGVWWWWGLEAALTLVGAVVPVWIALRRPFCPRCRTWYRVTRGGSIDRQTAHEIADRCGLPQASSGAAKYRLLGCRAGCALTAFELSWDESTAGSHCVFLDAPRRDEVLRLLERVILDGAISPPAREVGRGGP